jgi:hypothetical protein
MKIFIINGRGGCGKDTFVELCAKHVPKYMCLNVSTVDKVKEIARHCGWEGGKEDKDRKFLSDLKALLTEYSDMPHQSVLYAIKKFKAELETYGLDPDEAIVFIHCREPEAIQRLQRELDAVTVLIRRPSLENREYGNASDDGVDDYGYHFTIMNNGTLEDLESWAVALLAANNVKIIN